MAIKILFLTSSMNSGGAERVASTLANAWVARGDQVVLMPTFSGRGECFYRLSPSLQLVYLADLIPIQKKTLTNQIKRLYTLRQFIKAEQPDVIISFLSNVNIAAVLASLGLNIPVIICERTDPFSMPASRRLHLACRFTYPFASILMVQTQAVAAKYLASGWSSKRLKVIANPVSEQLLAIQHPPHTSTKKRLLSIGRLDEGKQFSLLINVFAKLVQRHNDWSLHIVGEGSLRPVLQKQINELGLKNQIKLAGVTNNIAEKLQQADIFVLTSRYEGFPNVLLEAMTVGLPCVSFDCPSGPREMTEDGQIAQLIPLNDLDGLEQALEQLMNDAELRETLGQKARNSVIERYALRKVLEQWDCLFYELGVKK